jgi:transcriptional regulator with XRE-family HTH domain
VDAVRLGAVCRALRIKKGWRQVDLAVRVGCARSVISDIENGRIGRLQIDTLIGIVEALSGRLDFNVRWYGSDLDRLLNARHSALHEAVAKYFLQQRQWVIAPEVSFAIRGERGVIDILAWHAKTRTLLVIELKTDIVDINELIGTLDRKRRLAPLIARDRGWIPLHVGLWLIVGDSSTNRRRVARHSSTLRAALPEDGRRVGAWLRDPSGELRCVSFWANAAGGDAIRGVAAVRRVRRPSASMSKRESQAGAPPFGVRSRIRSPGAT